MRDRKMMEKQSEDKTITCPCGEEFLWTRGEQTFFASKGFPPPRHCRDCRLARRLVKDAKVESTPYGREMRVTR
jgi:hypothetical protein